jgi:adenosine deaminase
MDYIQAVIHEIQRQEEINSKIKVRYVISIDRTLSVEEAQDSLALCVEAQKLNPGYIVGIELSGDPRAGSFELLKPVFEQARTEHGLKVTLHCAETI